MDKLIDSLKEYFNKTPKDILDNDWNELKDLNKFGPDVISYNKGLRLHFLIESYIKEINPLIYRLNQIKSILIPISISYIDGILLYEYDDKTNFIINRTIKEINIITEKYNKYATETSNK